ncbi:hypothetical protein [Flavobacterium sp.]|uniref:hypothetical protein n=1 Tax=Flavobacterium sp. TaxID=239 RepID=UPI00286BE2D6|nr:hypothetical protein [Flavobacterium sp.]
MKNLAPIFIVITSVFSLNCFSQPNSDVSDALIENTLSISGTTPEHHLPIASYHVEERINMPFGSHITSYDVSNLSLIPTHDLGPNNVRIVTPRYAKVKVSVKSTTKSEPSKDFTNNITATVPVIIPIKLDVVDTVKKKYVDIDVLGTYERVLGKGYKSVDMFKKVGDRRFFGGDLKVAAKWYEQLFAMTTDLDPVYFYRYAESLKAAGLVDKAVEMMKVFDNKKP